MYKTMAELADGLRYLFNCETRLLEQDEIHSQPCGFADSAVCRCCPNRTKTSFQTHQYGYHESIRWNGTYFYYCPKSLAFCAFSDIYQQTGEIVVGPVILGDKQDLLLEPDTAQFQKIVNALPVFTPVRIRHTSELVTSAIAGIFQGPKHREAYDQAQFLNDLYILRKQHQNETGDYSYILQTEEEMKGLVRNGDKKGVQKLLNELLSNVYYQSYCNLDEVKTRCIELIVVLSRTVIDAGAEMGRIFHFSKDFLWRINSCQTLEDLCRWMTDILYGFIDAVFGSAAIKHIDAVHKTMCYIRDHWQEQISLEEIANHVYLSQSYLRVVFKKETGIGISAFINQVRIEHSKNLLTTTKMSIAEIASACHFPDQSYYTKVFRKTFGVSPKQYRDKPITL